MIDPVDEVARLALALPEVSEGLRFRHRTWFVNGKGFVWVRPLTKADRKRLGEDEPPSEPIIALITADLGEKAAILATNTPGFFTIGHFAEYPAFLIELGVVAKEALQEAVVDAWLASAPPPLAQAYLAAK